MPDNSDPPYPVYNIPSLHKGLILLPNAPIIVEMVFQAMRLETLALAACQRTKLSESVIEKEVIRIIRDAQQSIIDAVNNINDPI